MRERLIAAAFLVIAGCGASSDVLACGDKFLVVSRGTRFQRAATVRRPAGILVYANPASQLPRALANLPVEATLQKVGYRSTSVVSAEELDRALARGGWDLVLVDVADGQSVKGRLRGGEAPDVLPVLYKPTGTELAEAKHQYQRVLKSPMKNQAFLDAIDEALAERAETRAKIEGKTTH
jgi:hypothetical protein